MERGEIQRKSAIVKLTNLRAFEKHLEGAAPNHFSLLYIVMGKEAFQRKEAINKLLLALKGKVVKDEPMLQVFDGERISGKELMQELNAFGLFSQKRTLLVENADQLDKESMAALERYFDSPNQSIFLIISAAAFHRGTSFYKKSEKIGIVLEFSEEKPWEKERSIQEWIAATVKAEGKYIDSQCCQQLVKLLGTQQELLFTELQKLICYVGDRASIVLQDISALIAPVAVETIWQLGEAIFHRDGASALTICKRLLLGDLSFFALLRQLRTQFQTEFQVCTILANGGDLSEVTRQFSHMKGWILERHVALAQGYGIEGFKAGLLLIDAIEIQAKNSGLDVSFLAELLMVKLTLPVRGIR